MSNYMLYLPVLSPKGRQAPDGHEPDTDTAIAEKISTRGTRKGAEPDMVGFKSWDEFVNWLKTAIKKALTEWATTSGFANAVVRVLLNLDDDELTQVRERLLPSAEELPPREPTDSDREADRDYILELLDDPMVRAKLRGLFPERTPSKKPKERRHDGLAVRRREGLTGWTETEKNPDVKERLELILRVAEDVDRWPSSDLVESMIRWKDFSEAEVRRWLTRSNEVTATGQPTERGPAPERREPPAPPCTPSSAPATAGSQYRER